MGICFVIIPVYNIILVHSDIQMICVDYKCFFTFILSICKKYFIKYICSLYLYPQSLYKHHHTVFRIFLLAAFNSTSISQLSTNIVSLLHNVTISHIFYHFIYLSCHNSIKKRKDLAESNSARSLCLVILKIFLKGVACHPQKSSSHSSPALLSISWIPSMP